MKPCVEGFEFQVSRPKVIFREVNGETYEPFEEVQVDAPNEYIGAVMELLGNRRGDVIKWIKV